jgi:GNAT superfamily N-acetyltransferase
MRYTVQPLGASTWSAFAELTERNNGIFGGCWCMGYHAGDSRDAAQNRASKERRVREGRAHAALVFDENGTAQGWCQYGSPEELPGIKHRREYEKHAPPLPDWRITCFFVDKKHRGQGVAHEAHSRRGAGTARPADPSLRLPSPGRDRKLCGCSRGPQTTSAASGKGR